MFSRVKVTNPGSTQFSIGQEIENIELMEGNDIAKENGGELAEGDTIVLGITQVSLSAKSWLSAASFQNTNRVLIEAAVSGGIDELRGLKENVIAGRLIPAGTGLRERRAATQAKEEAEEVGEVEEVEKAEVVES